MERTRTHVDVPTFDAAVQAAAEMGISGEAARLIAKSGAQARHSARVYGALNLAIAWARNKITGTDMPESIRGTRPNLETVEHDVLALAWAVLQADTFGVGKPGSWARSKREAPLDACGKGRRNATDGAAWTAAIAEAAEVIRQWDPGVLWVEWETVDGALCVDGTDVGKHLAPATVQAIAGTSLIGVYTSAHRVDADAAAARRWAAVYNAACERDIVYGSDCNVPCDPPTDSELERNFFIDDNA